MGRSLLAPGFSPAPGPLLLSPSVHSAAFHSVCVSPLERTCLCMWKSFCATILPSVLLCFSFLYWSVLVSSLWRLLLLSFIPYLFFVIWVLSLALRSALTFSYFLHTCFLVFTSDPFKNIPGSWTFSLLVHEPSIVLHLFKSSLVFVCLFSILTPAVKVPNRND